MQDLVVPAFLLGLQPVLQQALESRRSRFEQLHDLKAKGIVGENNHGYVELFESNSAAKSLLESENRDRKMIYQTIAEQNGLEGQLNLIEEVFAQVQRDKADSGDKIQDADGRWIQK